ncbi:MAG TPA: KEOPS complex subunit Pcc1 [Thermoplasmata archaeon]|nr:KEOPS complex subunit Pcc1 [Thermoplasmata archaeon]
MPERSEEGEGLEVTVVAQRTYRSPEVAERIRRALAVDTPEFVTLSVQGPVLTIRTQAPSARSVRATLEDLFACLQVAERAAPGA